MALQGLSVRNRGRQGSRIYTLPGTGGRNCKVRLHDPMNGRAPQPGGECAAPKRTPRRTLGIAARVRAWFRGRPILVLVSGRAS